LPKPELKPLREVLHSPPETDTEQQLAELWQRLLDIKRVGLDDDFFDLGGNSLSSVRLFYEISRLFNLELPLSTLGQYSTIRGLAALMDGKPSEGQLPGDLRSLQVLQKGDEGVTPLFLIHGGLGNVLVFKPLVDVLDSRQPVFAFQWPGWDGFVGPTRISEMADIYKSELDQLFPEGSVWIGGYCIGGLIAIELANALLSSGRSVSGPLLIWDSPNLESKHYLKSEPWDSAAAVSDFNQMKTELHNLRLDSGGHPTSASDFDFSPPSGKAAVIRRIPFLLPVLRMGKRFIHYCRSFPDRLKVGRMVQQGRAVPMDLRSQYCSWCMHKAVYRHKSSGYDGDMIYFRSDSLIGRFFDLSGWWKDVFLGFSELCRGKFTAYVVGGGHSEILEIPEVGERVKRAMESGEDE
jgi:acyl carrier protein